MVIISAGYKQLIICVFLWCLATVTPSPASSTEIDISSDEADGSDAEQVSRLYVFNCLYRDTGS